MDDDATHAVAARPCIEFQNASALIELPAGASTVVGRSEQPLGDLAVATIRHRELAEHHVVLQRDGDGSVRVTRPDSCEAPFYVNGHVVETAVLLDEDVLQCGPLAWKWDAGSGVLRPVPPIPGIDLEVDAEVTGRLKRTKLRLLRGEMTALVGPSGCGKSTLLQTIQDGSGLSVSFLAVHPEARVYFVPQKDLVHRDLRVKDALRSIGKLYGQEVLPIDIDAALDAVGLPTSAKHKFPHQLSGGQLRRFRIAGALLSRAGVIVLDEPDSGLDHETADEVIRLLRSLAIRGATIVAVTHHRHVLEHFDRVIQMSPGDQGGQIHSDDSVAGVTYVQPAEDEDAPAAGGSSGFWNRLGRIGVLFVREAKKLMSPRLSLPVVPLAIPSCLVGWLLVPLLFAAAVAISVPTDPDRNLEDGLYGDMAPIARLGFLAVISVIWMSASQSHLSITRDRELSDYEQSHGVSWIALLTAKTGVFVLAGAVQTTVFAGILYGLRHHWLERSFFIDERWTQLPGVLLCLLFVSAAASCLGLFVSAIAGRAPLVATAILPVIMMFQILFSAPFAVSNPDGYEPLADYAQLTVFESTDEDSEDDWEDDWEDDLDGERPLTMTSLVSYATLSRYGDQWLRSFAVVTETVEQGRAVQVRAGAALVGFAVASFLACWGVLVWQTRKLGVRRSVSTRAAMMLFIGLTLQASSAPAQEGVASEQSIELELVDGRYNENQLRAFFGGSRDEQESWRELGNQDRLGLVALELVGKISFQLTEDSLTIERKDTPKWELMKMLAPPRLIGGDELDDQADVVLFVHGLEGGQSTFARASARCDEMGIASMHFEYPNDGPPDEIGELLAGEINELHRRSPGLRIHLIAHSLGGLISTWAITSTEFEPVSVPTVVTLGTPFQGSALATFHDELELFDVVYRLATGTPGWFDTVHDGMGEAAEALRPGSRFLTELQRRRRPPGVRLFVVAGTKSFLTEDRRRALQDVAPGELARIGVSPTYAGRIEGLLAARELKDGFGDGAVTVESALGLADPAGSTSFPLTHIGLVTDSEPLDWALSAAGLLGEQNRPAK